MAFIRALEKRRRNLAIPVLFVLACLLRWRLPLLHRFPSRFFFLVSKNSTAQLFTFTYHFQHSLALIRSYTPSCSQKTMMNTATLMFSKALRRAVLSSGTPGRFSFWGPLSSCSCSCLPSQPCFANGISYTPQFLWCLQQMATLALSCCYFATAQKQKQRRLTLPLPAPPSSHLQQIVPFQPSAAAAAAPRPNQQVDVDPLLLLVVNAAAAWAARIRLAHAIQAAGRERRLLKETRRKVLQQLIQERQKYYSRLDRFDKRALRDYTGNGFDPINRSLRKGAPAAKEQARIDALVRALTKSKTKTMTTHVGTVFRGTKKLPASMLDQLRPGATFCDPAFLSTSVERRVAFGIANGAILFEIESKSGVDVSKHSKSQYEAEVLFRPSTLFMIQSVEYGVDGLDHLVKMTELF